MSQNLEILMFFCNGLINRSSSQKTVREILGGIIFIYMTSCEFYIQPGCLNRQYLALILNSLAVHSTMSSLRGRLSQDDLIHL